jgi:hypothetical protein
VLAAVALLGAAALSYSAHTAPWSARRLPTEGRTAGGAAGDNHQGAAANGGPVPRGPGKRGPHARAGAGVELGAAAEGDEPRDSMERGLVGSQQSVDPDAWTERRRSAETAMETRVSA